jgi:DNA repair protein RadC
MSKDSIADSAAVSSAIITPQHRAGLDGVESLSDAELVSLVLIAGGGGASVSNLAASLLEQHGLSRLLHLGVAALVQEQGIGRARALRLLAALELGRRAVQVAAIDAMPRLPDQRAVVAWAKPRLATLDHEELWTLVLDGRHGLRAARRVASGGVHGLHVGVRDVLRVVLREAGGAFVLVHNHPSGDPQPSEEDVAFTKAVTEGATAIGTPFLDHIVVARQRSSSMLDLGLLSARRR